MDDINSEGVELPKIYCGGGAYKFKGLWLRVININAQQDRFVDHLPSHRLRLLRLQ